MDVGELRRFYAIRRTDFVVAITAIVGVVTTTVLIGLFIAVAPVAGQPAVPSEPARMSRSSRSCRAPGDLCRPSRDIPMAGSCPACSSSGSTLPLYFFNANVARTEILALARHEVPRPTG